MPTLPASLLLPAIALLLSGCAGQTYWDKPGATQADLRRDSYSCERDARQSGYYGSGIIGAINMQEFFGRCMEAQSYTLRRQGTAPAQSFPELDENGLTDEQCMVRYGVKCPPFARPTRKPPG